MARRDDYNIASVFKQAFFGDSAQEIYVSVPGEKNGGSEARFRHCSSGDYGAAGRPVPVVVVVVVVVADAAVGISSVAGTRTRIQ